MSGSVTPHCLGGLLYTVSRRKDIFGCTDERNKKERLYLGSPTFGVYDSGHLVFLSSLGPEATVILQWSDQELTDGDLNN